jgi:hypothetical protein
MIRITEEVGLELTGDHEMPSNNRILCWRKKLLNESS